MIIVKLTGGLGNQLFQYAAARAVAQRNNQRLAFDVSYYAEDRSRAYKLSHFSVCGSLISPRQLAFLTGRGTRGALKYLSRAARWIVPVLDHRVAEARSFRFDESVARSPGNIYMVGFWQSEKYFKGIEGLLRGELMLKQPPDKANAAVLESIGRANSVSLHVRRGDYVSDPRARQLMGALPLEYYRRAIEMIRQVTRGPHFFVFSDDMAWVRANLQINEPVTYVTHNGANRDYEDLRLMTHCRHHIIANSSFSWWGAWLCSDPGKTVIAPETWFSDASWDASDVLPESWIQL